MATPRHSGVDRCGHRRAVRRLRPARRCDAYRLRAGRHGGGDCRPRPGALRAGRPHAPRRLVARSGWTRQRRHDRPPRRRAARRGDHRRHVVPPAGRVGPAPWDGGHLRRPRLRVRGPAHRDVTVADIPGGAGQGRRRHVRSGHHQLRQCPVGRRHAGHRLRALRGRLPDLRRRGWSRRLVGQPGDQQPAAGVGGHRRRHRAAGGLAVGRGPPDRSRGPAGPRARDPSAGHRPGVGPLGSRDRHRTGAPTERDAADTAPERVGALLARGVGRA